MKYTINCRETGIFFTCLVLVQAASSLSVVTPVNTSSELSPPPTDLSHLKYIINSDVCRDNGSGVPIVAVMMVTSHIGNVKKRTIMREAYPADLLESIGVRRAFVLATLDQNTEKDSGYKSISEEEIMKESQLYEDIVQVNFIEAHRNLTYKNLMGMKYAVTYCGNASFVIKHDDDVLFDIYQMVDELKLVKEEYRDYLMGNVMAGAVPIRDPKSKYSVTVQEYPAETYPDYVSGFLFITSVKTTRLLVETSKLVPFLSIDDALITGIIAKKAGVTLVDFGDKVTLKGTLQCCRNDYVVYECAQMAALRTNDDDMLLKKISHHAAYCHKENTCQILGSLDKGNLTCF